MGVIEYSLQFKFPKVEQPERDIKLSCDEEEDEKNSQSSGERKFLNPPTISCAQRVNIAMGGGDDSSEETFPSS